jgi:hypothetical protein
VIFLCNKKETEWERRRGQFRFYLSLRYSFVLLAEEEEGCGGGIVFLARS